MHVVLLMIAASLALAFLARDRRLGFWGTFFASILLTPIAGLLLVAVSGPSEHRRLIREAKAARAARPTT